MRIAALLALATCGSVCAVAQPSSNWTTDYVQLTLPSAVTSAFRTIRALRSDFNDGYVYIGGHFGLARALVTCVRADRTDTACWTFLNTGCPSDPEADTCNGVSGIDKLANGKMYVTWRDWHVTVGNPTQAGTYDFNTATWTLSTETFGNKGLNNPSHDASGNLYASTAGIYKSTDGGVTWTSPQSGDGYGSLNSIGGSGFVTGAIFPNDHMIIGGNIYWGGEGPLIKQPTSFASFTNLAPTANGGCTYPLCFSHDMRGLASDGNETTAPSSEIIALFNHCTNPSCTTGSPWVVRYDVATSTWQNPTVPSTPDDMQYWESRAVAKGYTAGEYYLVNQDGPTTPPSALLGSIDGGLTWTALGSGVGGQRVTPRLQYLSVNLSDDTIFLASNTGEMWMHVGFSAGGASNPTVKGGVKVQGKVVIQ